MNENRIHRIFQISILFKGAHALIECIGGLLLVFVNTARIRSMVDAFTQTRLINDPSDFIASHLLKFAGDFSVSSQHFYAFYLLSHGLIKALLVIALLRNKLWAYPLSLFVLGFLSPTSFIGTPIRKVLRFSSSRFSIFSSWCSSGTSTGWSINTR